MMTEQVLKEELSYLIANIIAYEDIAFAEAYAERFLELFRLYEKEKSDDKKED